MIANKMTDHKYNNSFMNSEKLIAHSLEYSQKENVFFIWD